ncbi:MAG: DUF1428 family protein [Solirubrobacteraceae bacterium]|nr:DUF1428 family protein [Solirubrobacteraceae bacterium]
MARSNDSSTDGYVDIYLLPIPERNVAAYREQAMLFGQVAREYGALRYREFRGDDLDTFKVGDGDLLTAAVVDFRSRAHRDEVMAKVMCDARVEQLAEARPLADMTRMSYGGFETFVSA